MMNLEDLKKRILIYTGMDLNYYNPNMLSRRLKSLLAKHGMDSIDQYWEIIRKDYDELRRFLDYVTINVTKFERDPIKFNYLRKSIIPVILKNNRLPKIWSCACSSGEEPYSLAMILEDLLVDKSVKIMATDIDSEALKAVSNGIYSKTSVANLSEKALNKYFIKEKNDMYRVKDVLRERVEVKYFNLISDNYKRSYFDLVVCRNVIIHFARGVKDSLFKNFNSALKKEGFLFLGASEKMLIPVNYGFKHWRYEMYQKTGNIKLI
ncbi:CheR family methyltransferase [Thermodesulfobacteriota bacterium]